MIDSSKLDFAKLEGIVPAIIQDAKTKEVLMLGFMTETALQATRARKKVVFWSRGKNRLWEKGEESGNSLALVSIQKDCDNDTLLVRVNPKGPTCHTGARSCFAATDKG